MPWFLIGLIALLLAAGVPALADDIADLRARAKHGDARAQEMLRLLRQHEVNQQLEAVRRNQRQIQAQQDEMLQQLRRNQRRLEQRIFTHEWNEPSLVSKETDRLIKEFWDDAPGNGW